jgi:deoxyribonuclease-4
MRCIKKNYIIGAHLSIKKGFAQAVFEANAIGATAFQIFTKSSRAWKAKSITKMEITEWNDALKQTALLKKNICIHSNYLINLASDKQDIIDKSIASLIEECERAAVLEIPIVVLHPGSRGTQSIKEGCYKISQNLSHVLKATEKTIVALESMAGQGTTLGSSLEELAAIIDNVPKKFHSRIGVCLDTCHLFAAGYQLDTKEGYKKFWKSFDTIIGRDFLKVIHINDSKKGFGSHLDRHEEIEKGLIPKNVFIQLMNDQSLTDLPKILETPKNSLDDDARNIKRLLSYL